MPVKDAIDAIERIMKVSKIITPNYMSHHIALEFIKKYELKGNRIFDAYLAATAISHGIDEIATDNEKDFKIYPLVIINPFKVI